MIGFLFSIILLILLGMIVAYSYKKKLRQINKDASVLIGLLIIGLFWTVGILIYLDYIKLNINGYSSGRELMWNFPLYLGIIFSLNLNLDPYAVLIFLSYPLWYLWGLERSYQIWRKRKYQEGILYIFRLNEPIKVSPKTKKQK
ncbi:MAG: hypothetical protein ACTSR3_06695 [Candidatus Helarchaeota archaeon]